MSIPAIWDVSSRRSQADPEDCNQRKKTGELNSITLQPAPQPEEPWSSADLTSQEFVSSRTRAPVLLITN